MDRSDAYVGTYYTESAGDMLEISKIRDVVKVINKQNKEAEDRHNNHPMTDDYVSMPRYRVSSSSGSRCLPWQRSAWPRRSW